MIAGERTGGLRSAMWTLCCTWPRSNSRSCTWGAVTAVGSLVIVFLQIFSWFWQRNNFENRLIFGKVKAYKNGADFWATL